MLDEAFVSKERSGQDTRLTDFWQVVKFESIVKGIVQRAATTGYQEGLASTTYEDQWHEPERCAQTERTSSPASTLDLVV
jgi:hypothetical protein